MAAVYSDIIFDTFKFFPHLNFFGPPGSGKSYLGWSLASFFGIAKSPFNLAQGTAVGFSRKLAQRRNALIWFDEYSNDIDYKRLEALKAAYDRASHEKGVNSSDHRTVRTPVNSAVLITGQQQPVKDVALFKRCITINFIIRDFTAEQRHLASQLKSMESRGILSQFTAQLHRYRPQIIEQFDKAFDAVVQSMKANVSAQVAVEERILLNHCIPLTVFSIIKELMDIPYSYTDLERAFAQNIVSQTSAIHHEDEISIWWRLVQYFIDEEWLKPWKDFIVQVETILRVKESRDETKVIELDKPSRILYLRLSKAHPLYQKHHKEKFGKQGLGLGSLKHYLSNSDGYLGEVKAKKFGSTAARCIAIKLDDVPDLELLESERYDEAGNDIATSTPYNPAEGVQPRNQIDFNNMKPSKHSSSDDSPF